jgi:hypothetical protein
MKVVRNEILFRDSFIVIEYNYETDFIHANWRGFNNYETITTGCNKLLEFVKERQCVKVLNDNTKVEGIWSAASKWVGQEWLPQIQAAGVKHFAWVYSPSIFSRMSADKALKNAYSLDFIQTFEDIEEAEEWLRTC